MNCGDYIMQEIGDEVAESEGIKSGCEKFMDAYNKMTRLYAIICFVRNRI